MKITIVPAARLNPEHVDAWSQIQRISMELDSPYFRPEYTQAVAAIRNDVEVAVLEEHGEMVGFFPYQRARGNIAQPVGGRLSDFQGVIVRKDVNWDPLQLLQGCSLRAWHFDHMLTSQEPLRSHHRLVEDSPNADLSGGFGAYAMRHGGSEDSAFSNLRSKARKLQQTAGPLRFEADIKDQKVFDTLIEWKTQQYLRTGATNVFAFSWTRALLERILHCRGEEFSGMLSALYAGDQLVAAHFGMRSRGVLHFWFPSYDPAFAKFSPGGVRDLELMKFLAANGAWRLDFGKGMDQHKSYFMSAASQVAVGSVDLRPLTRTERREWHRACKLARESPLRRPARVLYRIREWLAFH